MLSIGYLITNRRNTAIMYLRTSKSYMCLCIYINFCSLIVFFKIIEVVYQLKSWLGAASKKHDKLYD